MRDRSTITQPSAPQPFADKLAFLLRALSMSRGRLAAELGVDKSIVGRWVTGAVRPSAHSLSMLTALVARRAPGFTALDWERDTDDLALVLGLDRPQAPAAQPPPAARAPLSLPLPLLEQAMATTELRGEAYEGFFRTTRPYAQQPGQFLHDQVMIRRDPSGFMGFSMAAGGVLVRGAVLLLQNQLFVIGAELTSGAYAFAIFNGVNTLRAGLVDGLILSCALDAERTPTASGVVFERVGDLSHDAEADSRRFAELSALPALAPPGSLPETLKSHLARDVGPEQMALGGDWLLRLPLSRCLSRGVESVRF